MSAPHRSSTSAASVWVAHLLRAAVSPPTRRRSSPAWGRLAPYHLPEEFGDAVRIDFGREARVGEVSEGGRSARRVELSDPHLAAALTVRPLPPLGAPGWSRW